MTDFVEVLVVRREIWTVRVCRISVLAYELQIQKLTNEQIEYHEGIDMFITWEAVRPHDATDVKLRTAKPAGLSAVAHL